MVELFGNIFAPSNSSGTWAVCIKILGKNSKGFWRIVQIIYKGLWKIGVFDQYLALVRKWCKIELLLQRQTKWCPEVVYDLSIGTILMTLNDPWPRFQGHPIFDAEYLSDGRHSYNGKRIGTRMRSVESCHSQWPLYIMTPNLDFKVMPLWTSN